MAYNFLGRDMPLKQENQVQQRTRIFSIQVSEQQIKKDIHVLDLDFQKP